MPNLHSQRLSLLQKLHTHCNMVGRIASPFQSTEICSQKVKKQFLLLKREASPYNIAQMTFADKNTQTVWLCGKFFAFFGIT